MDMHQKSYRYTRDMRLLNAKDFDGVFNQRDLVLHNKGFTYFIKKHTPITNTASGALITYHDNVPRIGFVLAKKKIKRAVGRNRVRRQHREIFRQMQHLLPPCDIVVLAKNGADQLPREQLAHAIKRTFLQIPKKLR